MDLLPLQGKTGKSSRDKVGKKKGELEGVKRNFKHQTGASLSRKGSISNGSCGDIKGDQEGGDPQEKGGRDD